MLLIRFLNMENDMNNLLISAMEDFPLILWSRILESGVASFAFIILLRLADVKTQ